MAITFLKCLKINLIYLFTIKNIRKKKNLRYFIFLIQFWLAVETNKPHNNRILTRKSVALTIRSVYISVFVNMTASFSKN